MNSVVEILLFLAGSFVGAWWFILFIQPLFYGFPRGLYWAAKGWTTWRVALLFLVNPIIWTTALVAVTIALTLHLPNVATYLSRSYGFLVGQIVGIFIPIWKAIFSRSVRIDMGRDFYAFIRPHLTPTGAVRIGVPPIHKGETKI